MICLEKIKIIIIITIEIFLAIFKCADNHGCSHTCGKINSVDTCSCPSGMELDSTNKTCVGK